MSANGNPQPGGQLLGTDPNDTFKMWMNLAQVLAQPSNLPMPALQMPAVQMTSHLFPSLAMNPTAQYPNLQMPGLQMPAPNLMNLPMNSILQQNAQLWSLVLAQHQALQIQNPPPLMNPNAQQTPQLLQLPNLNLSTDLLAHNQLNIQNPALAQGMLGLQVSTPSAFPTPGQSPASSGSVRPALPPPAVPTHPYRPQQPRRPFTTRQRRVPREITTEQVSDEKWQEVVDYCKASAVYNSPLGSIGLEALIDPAGTHEFPQTVKRILFPPNRLYYAYKRDTAGDRVPKLWKHLSEHSKKVYEDHSDNLKEEFARQVDLNWICPV